MKKSKVHSYKIKDSGDRFYVYRDGKLIAGFTEKQLAEIFLNAINQSVQLSMI